MEATILFVAVAALILLAVTSMRFGVGSRDGFASKERELAARGIIWDGPVPARNRHLAPAGRMTQVPSPRQPQGRPTAKSDPEAEGTSLSPPRPSPHHEPPTKGNP